MDRWLGGLAFSNVLPAAIGAALTSAGAAAIQAPGSLRWAAIAASGAFVIYGLDRLRDTPRDRASSPLRTAFVERNAHRVTGAVGLAAIALAGLIATSPLEIAGLCGVVGAIGLFHRRLKGNPFLKTLYVAAAWTASCSLLPWLGAGPVDRPGVAETVAWVIAIFFCALWSNVIAANLSEATGAENEPETGPSPPNPRLFRGQGLAFARAVAVLGILVAWIAPSELRPLIWIPAAEALALSGFRPSEHYEHLVIDGAIAVGSVAALIHFGGAA